MVLSLRPFKKVLRLLRPKLEIGGLDISDSGILFLSIEPETGSIKSASVRLPEGVITDGKVLKKDELIKALKQLHQKITPGTSKKIPVVVSVSDANVYSQQFKLPPLQSANLEEAIRLNLQVLSPIDFSKAYSDWQKLENHKTRETEILASFIERDIIDNLSDAISKSNFLPIVIEQKAMSLARVVTQLASGRDPKIPFLLLYISSDGLGFSIIKQDNLYFNRFTPWSVIIKGQQRQISVKEFSDTIIQESHRIMNFYMSHFNESISSLYIIAPGMESQVKQIVETNFSFKIEPLILKGYSIEQSWLDTLGAALRGITPRSIDTDISLAPEGTESLFLHSQILAFAQLWRNIIITVCSILLIVGVGLYFFLGQVLNKSVAEFDKIVGGYNVTYLNSLMQQAQEFNRSVSAAVAAKQQQTKLSGIISSIYAQAEDDISIDRIYIQGLNLPVLINGKASSANFAVNFKNRLAGLKFITGVDLPLSNLNVGVDQTTFTIHFNISPSSL